MAETDQGVLDAPQQASVPSPVEDAWSQVMDLLQSNIGRWVTFILTPILLPLVGAAAYWLQDVVGVNLKADPAVVTAYIVAVVGGLAAMVVTWLRNRGNHERQALEALTVMKAGEDHVAHHPVVLNPQTTPTPARARSRRAVRDEPQA
jgi:hypothetical protein